MSFSKCYLPDHYQTPSGSEQLLTHLILHISQSSPSPKERKIEKNVKLKIFVKSQEIMTGIVFTLIN